MRTQESRFKFIRERAGLSKAEFAAALSIPPSLESYIESGQRRASLDVLQRLADAYAVNINWFLSGDGEPFLDEIAGSGDDDSVSVLRVSQEVAAGRGVDIDEYADTGTIAVPRALVPGCNPRRLRALTVRGDSMIERHIADRDIVVFNTADREGESVSVVSVAGQLLVKHVSFDPIKQRLTLTSANPVYPPRVIEAEDLASATIEGRVIACLHRM
jgi:transcriptional regulator with XRE-family HTH domain